MAAHRYWKTTTLEAQQWGDIELTEFWLLAGTTRVDAAATLTGTAPISGALADLKDDDTATGVTLPPGASLQWDFGVGGSADVTDIRLGAAANVAKFPMVCGLAYSDDGVAWTPAYGFAGILWPGARQKTVSEQLGNLLKAVPLSAASSGAPALTSTTVRVFDNNGVVLPVKSTGVRQIEAVRSSVTGSGIGIYFGVASRAAYDAMRSAQNAIVSNVGSIGYASSTGNKFVNGVATAYGATYTTGDVIGCVVDFSTGQVTFYKNGVSQGVAGTISLAASAELMPFIQAAGSAGESTSVICALRTRGFMNAIAGAVPWEDRTAIATSMHAGRAMAESAQYASTLGAMPVGKAGATPPVVGGRNDYYLGSPAGGRLVGRVKGTTKDKGTPNVPVSERVRLFREQDGYLVREVWSAPGTGAYSFDYVDETQTYTVISYDHDKAFRAVIADNLTLANGGVELIA